MKILCTFPGKFGDLIWALPTIRAISEAIGEPVDLVIAGAYGSIVPLLKRQAYLGVVWAEVDWQVQNTAPMTPRVPQLPFAEAQGYDHVFHLGYRWWPETDLARETWACFAGANYGGMIDLAMEHFDLTRPWIIPPYHIDYPVAYTVGFTDEHFELKFGLAWLLHRQFLGGDAFPICVSNSPRWNNETALSGAYNWESAAAWLAISPAFLGCNSALHVLARAMGVPVVMMEPNPQRHNDIFYPYGKSGKGVELVCGNDGLPTFDARHVWDSLQRVLAEQSARRGVAASGGTPTYSSSPHSPGSVDIGSNAANAATAPPDGPGSFVSEQQPNSEEWW